MQRFRGGLVFKAHRLRGSLNSRLESNKEEEDLLVIEEEGQIHALHDVDVHIVNVRHLFVTRFQIEEF